MRVQIGQRANRTLRPAPTQARPEPGRPQFTPYSAGNKSYGGGRPMPNIGKTANMTGYAQRDAQMAARRQAFMDRAKRF